MLKDEKIFQKVYIRAKRGKDKEKVKIKLKRLHRPRRMNNNGQTGTQGTAEQLSGLEEHMEHQEITGTNSLDPSVTSPQVEQSQENVLVEDSIQLEEGEHV